jgi:GNAT superfamily N-acetyltransferase
MADLIRPLGRPGDLGWVVARHGEIYAAEFGWDTSFEALVARIVADYADKRDPQCEAAWIAEVDGERAGCVFCVRRDERTAQLRILLVEPRARGRKLGQRLVRTCLDFARGAGYEKMMLWTNHPLAAARRIYLAEGFELLESEEHDSFGHRLVGQVYERSLFIDSSQSDK